MFDEVLETRGSRNTSVDGRRRIPGAPKKCFVVTEMWDRHHEIARRIVLGANNIEIANALNVTPTLVSNVRNSPVVQEKIKLLSGARDAETVDIAAQIAKIAPKALTLLGAMIEGKVGEEKIPAKLRAHHAEKMLDRAGHGAPKIIQGKVLHGHFTAEDLDEIKDRAARLGVANGSVVEDAEIIDEALGEA